MARTLMALMIGVMCMTLAEGFDYGTVTRTTIPGQTASFYTDALPEDCPLPMRAYRVGYRLAKHGLAGVPFILWPEDMTPPQDTAGYWLEVLVPQEAEGVYEFSAGDCLCRVQVAGVTVPPAKADFGFYYERRRSPACYRTPAWEQVFYTDMAEHGHNTVTVYDYAKYETPATWGTTEIDERIDLAMRCGLISKDHPVIVLPGGMTPQAARELVDSAPEDWPELLIYGPDEPAAVSMPSVARSMRPWREAGLRTVTAINREAVQANPTVFDVWLVLHGGIDRRLQALAATNQAVLATYDHRVRGTNYRLNRYYSGVYTWAFYLKANYVWAYTHDPAIGITEDAARIDISSGYVLPSPHGPLPTVGYCGRRDGILDFRLLCAVEEQCPEAADLLADLRRAVPRESFGDPAGYYWDVPDTYDPMVTLDFEGLRERLVEYLCEQT